MKAAVRNNGLSLFFGALFLAALFAQAIAGHANFNEDQIAHHGSTISLGQYVLSASYGAAVLENWQSEYLQFTLMMLATIWLLQRGSSESKEAEKLGRESDEDQMVGDHAKRNSPKWAKAGGWRTAIYSNSLLIVMGLIWIASWFGSSVTGWAEYSDRRIEHQQDPVSWLGYIGSPDFWERTFQNWQSEFLAVGSMAILAVYLRQRGSPESKPVGAPHTATGVEG
jgi:hypothetical protein